MDIELVKCPACGGDIDIKGLGEFSTCRFCNSTIHIRKRNVNQDGSVTLIDKSTGVTVGSVKVPFGYTAAGYIMPNISSYTYPIGVSASAYNDKGNVMSYFIGESYTDRSKCPIMNSMYSKGMEQVSNIHYKDFLEVREYLNQYANMYASQQKATGIRYVGERNMPLYEPIDYNEVAANFRQSIELEKVRNTNNDFSQVRDEGIYLDGVCMVYDILCNNISYRVALSTLVKGNRYHLSALDMGGMYGGMMPGFGLLGSLFNKAGQQGGQNKPQSGAFNDMPTNSVIDWMSDGVFILQALPDQFEEAFSGAFTDFCSTFRIDRGIKERSFDMQSQILQNIANHTQNQINQMNRQFQTWQQINRDRQAAFDRANQAWWDRSNSHHAQVMASSHQSSYGSSSADKFSEAIRGVNTYIREDGTETEVSVAYDRAYSNGLGDTLGSNSAFEPGGNWTEMQRKW